MRQMGWNKSPMLPISVRDTFTWDTGLAHASHIRQQLVPEAGRGEGETFFGSTVSLHRWRLRLREVGLPMIPLWGGGHAQLETQVFYLRVPQDSLQRCLESSEPDWSLRSVSSLESQRQEASGSRDFSRKKENGCFWVLVLSERELIFRHNFYICSLKSQTFLIGNQLLLSFISFSAPFFISFLYGLWQLFL